MLLVAAATRSQSGYLEAWTASGDACPILKAALYPAEPPAEVRIGTAAKWAHLAPILRNEKNGELAQGARKTLSRALISVVDIDEYRAGLWSGVTTFGVGLW